jgi:hypothetical protein
MERPLAWLLSRQKAWCVKKKWICISVAASISTTESAHGRMEVEKRQIYHMPCIRNRSLYVIARIRNSKKN